MGGFGAFVSARLSEKRHPADHASFLYTGNYNFAHDCDAPPMTLARIADGDCACVRYAQEFGGGTR